MFYFRYLIIHFFRVFKSSISDAGKEQFFNLHRKLMIQQVCLQQIKNKELAKNLNYDHLLNEFLTWNSINSFVVSACYVNSK